MCGERKCWSVLRQSSRIKNIYPPKTPRSSTFQDGLWLSNGTRRPTAQATLQTQPARAQGGVLVYSQAWIHSSLRLSIWQYSAVCTKKVGVFQLCIDYNWMKKTQIRDLCSALLLETMQDRLGAPKWPENWTEVRIMGDAHPRAVHLKHLVLNTLGFLWVLNDAIWSCQCPSIVHV